MSPLAGTVDGPGVTLRGPMNELAVAKAGSSKVRVRPIEHTDLQNLKVFILVLLSWEAMSPQNYPAIPLLGADALNLFPVGMMEKGGF